MIRVTRSRSRDVPRWPYTVNADNPSVHGLKILGAEVGNMWRDIVRQQGTTALGDAELGPSAHGGLAAKFDGSGDSMAFDSPFNPNTTDAFTVAFWMRPAQSTARADVFDVTTAESILVRQRQSANDDLFFYRRGNTGVYYSISTTGITANNDWLVVATYAASLMTLYINGVSRASNTLGTGTQTATTSWRFGINANGSANPYSGAVWSPAIWDRPLSSAEVWRLYDPASRWDLYYETGRRTHFIPAAAPPGGFIAAWAAHRSGMIGAGLH